MRYSIVLLPLWLCGLHNVAQAREMPPAPFDYANAPSPAAVTALPDSPGTVMMRSRANELDRELLNEEPPNEEPPDEDKTSSYFKVDEIRVPDLSSYHLNLVGAPTFPSSSTQSRRPAPTDIKDEPYHWKGLILQSVAFSALENGVRIMTADQEDRHILLNKPFWSDYFASVQQFNMRRWNDGDSFLVNYIGHPLQGAVFGYIEIQNDPRGRELEISSNPQYWKSIFRALIWSTVTSTQSEIGPMGEAAIFNAGGFTYPIHCPHKDKYSCPPTSKYTNNTGWVDFIITPTVGTIWLLGSDAIDRYVTDPLVQKHPRAFGYKMLRAGLNPAKSLANILRGHFPWFRDYEHPGVYESLAVEEFQRAMDVEPRDHVDVFLHYTALTLNVNMLGCAGCRRTADGAGIELGFAVRRYLDLVIDSDILPGASPESSLNVGGTLWTGHAGLRSGYSGKHFALKVTLAPGFASYSRSQSAPAQPIGRNYNFSAIAALSADIRFTDRIAFRLTTEQMLIRYKSLYRDRPESARRQISRFSRTTTTSTPQTGE